MNSHRSSGCTSLCRIAAGAVVLLVSLSQCGLAKQQGALPVATEQAGVASADNTVEKESGNSGQWAPAAVGDLLAPGDHLRTGASSGASLLLSDRTVMRLSENTEIVIVDLRTDKNDNFIHRFKLAAGKIWSDVTPGTPAHPTTYEVVGPNAVAAVKGTSFEVEASGPDTPTNVRVWDGTVACRPPGSSAVAPTVLTNARLYNSLSAAPGGAFEPGLFDRSQPDNWQKWNRERTTDWHAWCKRPGPRKLQLNSGLLQSFHKAFHKQPFFRPLPPKVMPEHSLQQHRQEASGRGRPRGPWGKGVGRHNFPQANPAAKHPLQRHKKK